MPFQVPEIDFAVIGMPAFLMVWAMLVLFVDLFTSNRRVLAPLSILGLVLTAGVGVYTWNASASTAFLDMVILDQFGTIANWIILAATALALLVGYEYLPRQELLRGEFYPLVLIATSGMLLLVQANDLVMLFIAVELLSIALYVLTGFAVPKISSGEAAIKYLLLGAFAAGFLVFGIALVYGSTTTLPVPADTSVTSFTVIGADIQAQAQAGTLNDNLLLTVGMGMILIALGFKVSLVPFHAWTPDVYEGAPTPVTAYMSVATKGAAFVAMLRLLTVAFPELQAVWQPALAVLAAITMAYGNIVAVAQTNLKRMLAYSSIAHAGYMMLGILPISNTGASAFLVYLLAYGLTNVGAFAVLVALENRGQALELDTLRGVGRRHPLLGVAMTIFMFSLAGIPLTAGFMGKFGIFRAAWEANLEWLALVAVVTSVISAFFYLRVTVLMFMREESADGPAPTFADGALVAGIVLALVGILALGIIPTPMIDLLETSGQILAAR